MPAMPEPLTNQLLIALPALAETNFSRSVALICQHDDDGAMGIVVNRRSEYTLGEVLGQMGVEGGNETPARPAGPGRWPGPSGARLRAARRWPALGFDAGDHRYAVPDHLARHPRSHGTRRRPDDAIVALGCAGWGSGQLEHELTENDWLTAPADAELLFTLPLESRWQAAAGRIGVDFAHLADYAGHA